MTETMSSFVYGSPSALSASHSCCCGHGRGTLCLKMVKSVFGGGILCTLCLSLCRSKTFRPLYANIGEICAVIPSETPLIATAT